MATAITGEEPTRIINNEIKRLNRRLGQLNRHSNIWEGFRFEERAETERDIARAKSCLKKAQSREKFFAEFWA